MNGRIRPDLQKRGHPHLWLAGDPTRDPDFGAREAKSSGAVRGDDRTTRFHLGRPEAEERLKHVRRWPWTTGYIIVALTVLLLLSILQSTGLIP